MNFYNNLIISIKEFQDLFIKTYVDKANVNFPIIWPSLYGDILKSIYDNKVYYEMSGSNKHVIGNRNKIL